MKVTVLGGTGMLGAMVLDVLLEDQSLQVTATARTAELEEKSRSHAPRAQWQLLDAERCDVASIVEALSGAEWVVNAIGVIKPYIHDDNAAEVERAIRVNALFPHALARAAAETNCHVLQIGTDCVYSGVKGRYTETDAHDALDAYGKTKSLGEVHNPNVHHLRCSIIGPEVKGHVSLLDWFLGQPRGGKVNGFTNHEWNGVTTMHYAKLCRGIIKQSVNLGHLQHAVPSGTITKCDLLRSFAREFQREDIEITPTEAKVVIDRTLSTSHESLNRQLWAAAGHPEPPTVPEMVAEMAARRFSLRAAV